MVTSKSQAKIDETTQRVSPPSDEDRMRMIAEAAYFEAERRGFVPGHESEDWLAAEARLASQNWLATEVGVLSKKSEKT